MSVKDGEWKIIADSLKLFNPAQLEEKAALQLSLPKKMQKHDVEKLQEIFAQYPGKAKVLVMMDNKSIEAKTRVLPSDELLNRIAEIIGKKRITLVYLSDNN